METHIFYHPSKKDLYYNNIDKRIYTKRITGEYLPVETTNLINAKHTKGFHYKSRLLSFYRTVFECYNGIEITEKGYVTTYENNLVIPDDFDPAKLTNILKSDWMKERHNNGSMDETLVKVKNYLRANCRTWTNKAVVNTTTGEEFESAVAASKAIGFSDTAVAHGIRYGHKVNECVYVYKDPVIQAKVEAKRSSLKPLKWIKKRPEGFVPRKYVRKEK